MRQTQSNLARLVRALPITPQVSRAEAIANLIAAGALAERCLTRTAQDERDVEALRALRAAIKDAKELQ